VTSILSYVPLIGEWLTRTLLGGPEVGPATLLTFYSLHISWIPLGMVMLMSLHFWRVRKDGGLSMPRKVDEKDDPKSERVTTIPHLVRRELVWAVVWFAALLLFSMLVPAPLEEIADPLHSPNPAKAPWYFLGLQELLLHFHPLIAGVVIPGLALGALFLLPFIDVNLSSVGIYFRSHRGRALSLMAAGSSLLLTPLWIVADEFLIDWAGWLPTWPSLLSNGLIPMALVLLFLVMLDEAVRRMFHTDTEERILFIFVFLFVALAILTITGIYFRGTGMVLMWPWDIAIH